MSLNFASDPVQPSSFEALEMVCLDCSAPLQEAPSWAERPGQKVYRCPWANDARRLRVEHSDVELLVYNCNWPKGSVARRISGAIR